jgi:hypothetical protein
MNMARRSRNQTGERLLVIFFAGLAAWREIILAAVGDAGEISAIDLISTMTLVWMTNWREISFRNGRLGRPQVSPVAARRSAHAFVFRSLGQCR